MGLIKKLRNAKKEAGPNEKPAMVKTHLRDMIIVPEMIGSVIGVYVSRACTSNVFEDREGDVCGCGCGFGGRTKQREPMDRRGLSKSADLLERKVFHHCRGQAGANWSLPRRVLVSNMFQLFGPY